MKPIILRINSQKVLDYLKQWLLNKGITIQIHLALQRFCFGKPLLFLKRKQITISLFEETKEVDRNFDIIILKPTLFQAI